MSIKERVGLDKLLTSYMSLKYHYSLKYFYIITTDPSYFPLQSKIFYKCKKGHFVSPILYLLVTNTLTAFWQIFFFFLLGVSNGTLNQIDYTMIQNSH